MAKIVLAFGLALIALGVGAYFGSGMPSVTALIPAFFGAVIVVLGAIATRPAWTRGAVVVVAVVSALGTAGSLSRIVLKLVRGEAVQVDLAAGTQIAMAVVTFALVIVCVAWLLRSRKRAGATPP